MKQKHKKCLHGNYVLKNISLLAYGDCFSVERANDVDLYIFSNVDASGKTPIYQAIRLVDGFMRKFQHDAEVYWYPDAVVKW